MKISTQTRYAVRMMLEIAKQGQNSGFITLQEIASKQGISEKYTELIASKLRKAGYVQSLKGVGGGYKLAKAPENISVGEVMRLMESSYFQVHCYKHADVECKNYRDCKVADAWRVLEANISATVDSVKLSDFLP